MQPYCTGNSFRSMGLSPVGSRWWSLGYQFGDRQQRTHGMTRTEPAKPSGEATKLAIWLQLDIRDQPCRRAGDSREKITPPGRLHHRTSTVECDGVGVRSVCKWDSPV
jgi:hypothetical protein